MAKKQKKKKKKLKEQNFKLTFCLLILVLLTSFLSIGMEIGMLNAPNPNGEDLVTLEAEISELQRENARVESQMLRLKSDISAMESHLNHGERVRLYKSRLVEAEN